MTALAAVRRKRTAIMLSANLLAIVALGGMGYAGYKALRRYEGATKVTVDSIKMPSTPVGMLATVDESNELTTITVFVRRAGATAGGSIVSVPVSSDSTAGGGEDRIPLTQVYAEGGADALSFAVESTLSVTLDVTTVANPDDLAALLSPVAPVLVTLPSDVKGTSKGSITTLFAAGERSLSAKQAAQVLTAQAKGVTEAARRSNIEAVWTGVVASVGPGLVPAVQPVATPTTLSQLLTQVFAGPVEARGLPAVPIAPADNPSGKDVETLDRAEAIMVLASVAPAAMSAPAPGLVFRIEAPPGYEARVKFAVQAVLFLGSNVQSVYLGGDVHTTTRYLIDDPRLTSAAESTSLLFGATETLAPDHPIEGVDVILQLGTDFLNGVSTELPSTTTTSTGPG